MKDTDQKLLWESYLESKRPDYPDVDDDGDKKESMEKALKDKESKEDGDVAEEAMEPKKEELTEFEKKRLQQHGKSKTESQQKGEEEQNKQMKDDLTEEGMSNLEFTAAGRFHEGVVVDCVLGYIDEQISGLDSPHDWEQYADPENLLREAKDYIRKAMEDIPLTKIENFVENQKRMHSTLRNGDQIDQQ